ncbi:MAG: PaaI family thioesterase [Thermodesulfobacteriota bacterium]|nr:PaaI family thioesterase [Thermodesulfobacteriota bacterium]
MEKRLQKVMNHPLHRYLGVTAIQSESGRGELSIPLTENVVNPNGVFHGGVIYILCDVCAYGGLLSLMDESTEAVSHDIHVSVMRAAMLGDMVTFTSEVVKMGKSLCFIDVRVTSSAGIIASARVTKSLLSVKS